MADLPSGTVTLLFTDIEGSTRLLQQLGQAYGAALAAHRHALRAAVRAAGGYEVDAEGDGFLFAFERATDAVTAAAAGQRALAAHPWPAGVQLRVRMALHTGAPEVSADGYVGLDVHRAARLCEAGHGGQVLLSDTTRKLVEAAPPAGTTLRELGQHRLRDIEGLERVVQLVIEDLNAGFPPLRAYDPAREAEVGRDRPTLEVHTLGRFQVTLDGRVLSDEVWRRRKARQLLKAVLTRPGYRFSKDEAIELLWPESDPEAADSNLRSTVHALRRALDVPRLAHRGGLVVADRETIGLRPELGIRVDADAFEEVLADAQAAVEPLGLLKQANALYRGDYLPDDLYENWATARREALKRKWAELQLSLARCEEQAGDTVAAVATLETLLQADPCAERAAQELMRLHLGSGRRAEALRVYQRLGRALRDELGVEPSPATLELERQAASGQPSEAARGPSFEPTAFVCSYPFSTPGQLVDRESERERLDQLLESGQSGGRAVMLGAPAGTGKSALVGTLVRRAEEKGVLCLAGGCYEQKGVVPLGPFHDALADYLLAQPAEQVRADLGSAAADLARVVPELRHHLGLPEASDSEVSAPGAPAAERRSERLRQFGAVHACLRSLARRGPVLLCLEDLHAADAASLLLIHYLARQTRRLPLVLVGTFRTEEAGPGQPLGQLLTALTRERLAERLPLGPLNRTDSTRLAATLLDDPISERLAASLYAATEGNPLFIEQLVLALREEGRLERHQGVWRQAGELTASVPRIIREVIGQRLDRLSTRCHETLEMAAVLGHAIEHSVLLLALEPNDETALLEDLEEALEAQLLHETANGYVFGHAMLRETVYRSLSGPRRMRHHARAGETLERLAGPGAADRAAELAHHFALAGQDRAARAKALRYSLEAGRRAAAISSHREALTQFSRACALIEQAGDGIDPATRLAALEGRGYAERELAMWLACIASFRRVLELTDDSLRRAWARATVGYALHHTVDAAAALAECDAGLDELARVADEPDFAVARLRLQASKVIPLFLQGRYKELLGLGQQMVEAAAELDQPRPLAWAHNAVALAHMAQGRVESGIEHFQRNLEAAERVDDKVLMAIAHENLGLQHYRGGRFDVARAHLDRALALFRDSAAEHRAVMSLQALGRLWLAEGDTERAREQAELGLMLAEEAQDRFAGDCYDLLGAVHVLRAEWETAEASYQQALRIRERVGHAAGQVDALIGLALVQQRRGEWPQALEFYTRAVEIASAMDPSPQAVAARRHLARLLWLSGEDAAASEHLEFALALAEGIPTSFEYAPTLLVMAEFRWRGGELSDAIGYAERALAAGMTAEHTVEAHVVLATLQQMAERPGTACPHAAEALRLAERVGASRLIGLAHLAAGRVATTARDHATANGSFQAALNHLEAARTPYERALALRDHARALAGQGQAERAHAMLEEALDLFGKLGARPAATGAQALLDEFGMTPVRRA